MTPPIFELVKVAAFAAAVGLALTYFTEPTLSALVGLVTFWLLLARIS